MSSSLNICIDSAGQSIIVSDPGKRTEESRVALINRFFTIAVVFVGVISMYDAYLVFHFRKTIDEQNPFCAWLITLEPEFVSVFLLGKCLGTIGVVWALVGLFKYWRRVAFPVAMSLVVFQIGLMAYLHVTDGRRKGPINQLAMETTQNSLSLQMETPKKATRSSRQRKRALQHRRLARVQHSSNQQKSLQSRPRTKTRKINKNASGRSQSPVLGVDAN